MLYPGATAEQQAKIEVLEYLIGIASSTQGAEVWRALFSELRQSIVDKARERKGT